MAIENVNVVSAIKKKYILKTPSDINEQCTDLTHWCKISATYWFLSELLVRENYYRPNQ